MNCQLCGKKAIDSVCVCKECLGKAAEPEQAKRIRNIANVLNITACTDANIKNAMESLIEIAGELEIIKNAEKQEKK